MENLTKFEREVLAQALTDYDEGISESDLPREDPELFAKIQASLNEIERKCYSVNLTNPHMRQRKPQ